MVASNCYTWWYVMKGIKWTYVKLYFSFILSLKYYEFIIVLLEIFIRTHILICIHRCMCVIQCFRIFTRTVFIRWIIFLIAWDFDLIYSWLQIILPQTYSYNKSYIYNYFWVQSLFISVKEGNFRVGKILSRNNDYTTLKKLAQKMSINTW